MTTRPIRSLNGCMYLRFSQTSTLQPWWWWFRIAARRRLCTGPACAWCPRTRHGVRTHAPTAIDEQRSSCASPKGCPKAACAPAG